MNWLDPVSTSDENSITKDTAVLAFQSYTTIANRISVLRKLGNKQKPKEVSFQLPHAENNAVLLSKRENLINGKMGNTSSVENIRNAKKSWKLQQLLHIHL